MKTEQKLIMVVDDNEFDTFFTSKLIQTSSFSDYIIEFDDAKNALNYLKSASEKEIPSYIFLDIYMPLMNGFEFFEEFEKLPDPITNKTKLIFTSTTINDDYKLKVKKLSKNCLFTSKPLTQEFLKTL